MTESTLQISGLSTGFDWRNMIDQLMAVEHRRVDIIENKKTGYEEQLAEWQSFNTKLQALNTAVDDLKNPDNFNLFVANIASNNANYQGSDLLSVSTNSDAARGSYSVRILNTATSQKLSSNPFASHTEALGASYAGDIIINGKVITIDATDSLSYLASSINNANSGTDPNGVTASIVKYADNDYRLVLTSDETGTAGISLLNGGSGNLLQQLGWKDNQAAVVKNAITNGSQSDQFQAPNVAIQSLLGLSSGEASTGSLTIDGTAVSIDLASMSLNDIKDAINNAAIAGVSASIITEVEDGASFYRLQIDGTQTFADENNILNTLGILGHTSSDVSGKVSANALTKDGASITSTMLLTEIDGYNTFTAGGNPGGDFITLSGTDTTGADIGSINFNIDANTTVQDLLDQIESSFGNVVAYTTADGKIQVDDLSGGTALTVNLAATIQDGNSQLDFGNFDTDATRKREVIAGQDAVVEIDGVAVTTASNVIDDVISGVTLNLAGASEDTTLTLNIDHDNENILSNLETFVEKYNDVMDYIDTQFNYDTEAEETGGILFGDGTLRSVKDDLTALLGTEIWGLDSAFSSLALIGIENRLNGENKLELRIDEAKLNGYLRTNFKDVVSLFVGQGTPESSLISYIGHSRDTKPGEYAIHIDQAATRAEATGSVDLSGGGINETLSITQGDNTAQIAITAGMSMNDIINEINTELDSTYAQTIVGDEQLYADASQTSVITASTTWDTIYNNLGVPLSFANDDTISFTATTNQGSDVSGTYQISDITTDTVQGLLSAIEDVFASQVSASIDSSGRIVVKDIRNGSSELAISSINHGTEGEFFGSVDITDGAGDSSQTGRYALGISASVDENNYLVLTNDAYGSASSFSISQVTSQLGLTDGEYQGLDVVGTIDGESATGSGQVLTGNEGNTNTDGLSVRYRGTDDNMDMGTIKVTLGVGERFHRTLFNITDSIDGYVTFKQSSLQDKINSIDEQIEQVEARLDKKMQRLINQYVAMELTLNQLQNQSDWLVGQTNALFNGWN